MQMRKLRLVLEYAKVVVGFARVIVALLNMGINYVLASVLDCGIKVV